MKNELIINTQNFIRTKKKLKKSLEKRNIDVSLSESGEILSEILGFKNNFELQSHLSTYSKKENNNVIKNYLDDIVFIYRSFFEYLSIEIVELKNKEPNYLSKIKNIHDLHALIALKINFLDLFYDDILHRKDENILEKAKYVISFSRLRNLSTDLRILTHKNIYQKFHHIFDNYHNIEYYCFTNLKNRDNFWLQPPFNRDNFSNKEKNEIKQEINKKISSLSI